MRIGGYDVDRELRLYEIRTTVKSDIWVCDECGEHSYYDELGDDMSCPKCSSYDLTQGENDDV